MVSVSPLAELLSERVSPEMLYLETKFASLVSYGLTVGLLGELLPLERPIGAERVRRHVFRIAEAHEAELASPAPTNITVDERTGPNNALPDGPLYVGMDGGYVRGREQGWFEGDCGQRAWFHSIAMAGIPTPPDAASLSFRQWTTSRVPASSTRFANRECSRSSRLSSCPMVQKLCAACSRTSPRTLSTCWTGSMSPCG